MPTWNILGYEIYIPDLDEIITAVTTPLTQTITDIEKGMETYISPLFDGINTAIADVVDPITTTITTFFEDPLNLISETVTTFAADLSALGPSLEGFFSTTWTNFSNVAIGLSSQLAVGIEGLELTLSGAVDGVSNTLGPAIDGAVSFMSEAFNDAQNAIGGAMGGLFSGFGVVDIDSVVESASNTVGILTGAIEGLSTHFSPITPDEARAWVDPFISQVTAAVTTLHTANAAAEAISLGQFDISLQEAWKYPNTAAAVSLAADLVAMPIKEGLMPAFKRYILRSYVPNLPLYSDMIEVYVKEGYLPEKWAEIPPEFVQNMKELGYSEYWTNRLWGKHWVLPAVTQLYEMYHRTLGTRPDIGVTLDVLRSMLKYHDFEPKWRDRLEAITWRTWRIFDLRTAWEMNILSDDELVDRSIDTGYNPEEAALVAETQKMFVYRSEIERLLSEADRDFIDGWINETQLRANYDATPFRPELKEMRIARAKLRRDRDAKKEIAAALKQRAIKLDLSLDEYAVELSKLGMVEDRIAIEQEKVRARLLKKPKAEAA